MNTIRIGNAPCSWGSLEFDGMKGKAIGYAQMLDELASTGYTGTELGDWGYMPTDPAVLRGELSKRGLTLLGAFVPVAMKDPAAHAPGETRVLQVARLLAAVHQLAGGDTAPFLVLADDNGSIETRTKNAGRIRPGMGLTDAEWGTYATGADRIAAAVKRETGLRTVFHHHCAGYVETPDEIDTLLRRTDPALLGLVFDTGHLAFGSGRSGGASVLEALDRFADRVWYMHFKDCHAAVADRARAEGWDYFQAVRQGVFCELGKGCVDFAAVRDWLKRRNYRGWALVEQDVLPGMGSPRESAQRNRDFLKTLGF
ncbi:MAG: TIM barrel protein [Verrucomicrobiales bacterium]|nr:TIM barrel protein [Verrucomicrobiales bacterium]